MKSIKDLINESVEARYNLKTHSREEIDLFIEKNPKPDNTIVCTKHNYSTMWKVSKNFDGTLYWGNDEEVCLECEDEKNELTLLNIPERYKQVGNDIHLLDRFKGSEFSRTGKIGSGLLISGSVGTGKTFMCIQIIKTYHKATGSLVKYRTIGEILRKVRESIGKNNYNDLYSKLVNEPLLVIDDIGVETVTDFMKEFLYNIVNDRYNAMIPILLTTNLSAEEFIKYYGERTYSRIAEMCNIVKLQGKDKRLNNNLTTE